MPPVKLRIPLPARKGKIRGPTVNVPESATLVGDKTGTPYARMGDSPIGAETAVQTPAGIQVIPPKSAPKSPAPQRQPMAPATGGHYFDDRANERVYYINPDGSRRLLSPEEEYAYHNPSGSKWAANGPVSMATGGFAAIGSGAGAAEDPLDPYRKQLQRAQEQLDQTNQLNAAHLNTADQAAVGEANTLRNSENYKYGAAGVALPSRVAVPIGGDRSALGPTAIEDYQTQEQQLGDEFNQRNRLTSAQDAVDAANRSLSTAQRVSAAPRAPTYNTGGGGGTLMGPGSMSPRGGGGGDDYGGGAPYIDPFTNMPVTNLTPAARAIREHQDQQRLGDMIDPLAAPERQQKEQRRADNLQGLDEYRDPFSPGKVESVTPAEKALREEKDKQRLTYASNQRFGQQDELGDIDEPQILQLVGKGQVPPETATRILTRRLGIPESQAATLVKAHKPDPFKAISPADLTQIPDLLASAEDDPDALVAALAQLGIPPSRAETFGEDDYINLMVSKGFSRDYALRQLDAAYSNAGDAGTPSKISYTGLKPVADNAYQAGSFGPAR